MRKIILAPWRYNLLVGWQLYCHPSAVPQGYFAIQLLAKHSGVTQLNQRDRKQGVRAALAPLFSASFRELRKP